MNTQLECKATRDQPQSWPKVSIVVLNWNAWQDTIRCLESIKRLNYENYEVIVVDNASAEGPPPGFQDQVPRLTFIQTGTNLGYTGGNNQGIKVALERGAEFVLVLNNDVEICDETLLQNIVHAHGRFRRAGILGPRVLQYDQGGRYIPDTVDPLSSRVIERLVISRYLWREGAGIAWQQAGADFQEDTKGTGSGHAHKEPSEAGVLMVSRVPGCAMVLTRQCVEAVGPFDERFFMYDEEHDICLRAILAGFAVVRIKDASIARRSVVAQRDMPPYRTYLLARNRFLLASRFNVLSYLFVIAVHLASLVKLAAILIRCGRWEALGSLLTGLRDGVLHRWGLSETVKRNLPGWGGYKP